MTLDELTPEQKADFEAFLNRKPPEVSPRRNLIPLTQEPVWAEITAKAETLMEAARNTPPEPVTIHPVEPTGLNRDILHTRFILGAESVFDGASFHNPDLKDTAVTNWFYEKFIPAGYRSALIIGGPGAGKTWGALAYVNSIARPNFQGPQIVGTDAAFVTAFRLAEMFANQKKFQDQLDRLKAKRILLIDDLGAEPTGFRGADFVAFFDHLFSERHMFKRITLITSNATKGEIREIYGARFVSRFNDNGSFLETRESDLRGKPIEVQSDHDGKAAVQEE